MLTVRFNRVIRFHAGKRTGLWRVLSADKTAVFLARIRTPEDKPPQRRKAIAELETPSELERMIEANQATVVELISNARYQKSASRLNARDAADRTRRASVMSSLLDQTKLAKELRQTGSVGRLIRSACKTHKFDIATAYQLFHRLVDFGFEEGSLNPERDKCGAPGILRPAGAIRRNGKARLKAGRKPARQRLQIEEATPQQGVTEEQREAVIAAWDSLPTPKPQGEELFSQVIERAFVTRYERDTQGNLIPIWPQQGTFPNPRQLRYIIVGSKSIEERRLAATVRAHYDRNMRGLTSVAHEGIAGPGHSFVIDSTLADIYLRSSVNRAWFIGRPILYILVDVWSSAIVGFYLCLAGPSWATAKVALFCSFAPAPLVHSLYGFSRGLGLDPAPSVPYSLVCDRGEYLSEGARITKGDIGIMDLAHDPSRRPDMKGTGEIRFRLVKEEIRFIPGAIDARRKEIELRPNMKASVLTLREFAQTLMTRFAFKNAKRSLEPERLTADMVSAGVPRSSAALWQYGYAVGAGYEKATETSKLITSLLPLEEATVRANGIYFGGQKYAFPTGERLRGMTAIARNVGVYNTPIHVFPANSSKVWWAGDPAGLIELNHAVDSPFQDSAYFDEWTDAFTYRRASAPDDEYLNAKSRAIVRAEEKRIVAEAQRRTQEAEDANRGMEIPSLREAREMEVATTLGQAPDAMEAVFSNPGSPIYQSLLQRALAK